MIYSTKDLNSGILTGRTIATFVARYLRQVSQCGRGERFMHFRTYDEKDQWAGTGSAHVKQCGLAARTKITITIIHYPFHSHYTKRYQYKTN
jgi:hypothetical protein